MSNKVRLLTHEETQAKHKFWEDSPNREAMDAALKIIAQMGKPTFYFLGERLDGLWIVFANEAEAKQFSELTG